MDEQKSLEERRLQNQVMAAYKKAIDNIIKSGREPGAALHRMYELQEIRNKQLTLRREMKKAARLLNGAVKSQ